MLVRIWPEDRDGEEDVLVVDVTEILEHWYAGRPEEGGGAKPGADAKTVRRYTAEAAGM